MKIIEIVKFYSPHIGGVEKHLDNINKVLIKDDNKVVLITEKYNKNLSNIETLNGVKIIRFYYPKIKYIGLLFIWFDLFKKRKILEKCDLVHIHDVAIWYLPFKFLYPNKKVVLTIHGWEGVYPIPLKNKLLKQLSVMIANKTIIVGKYLEKYYGIKADKIIYGAVDMSRVKKVKKDQKLIVYVGRLAKDTGLEVFLKALKSNKKYTVEFCGDGPLLEQCKKYGTVHGFIDPTPYMSKAAICFASGYLTIIEALANKCVVITAYNNQIRKDILAVTPFLDFIYKVNSSKSVKAALQDKKNRNKKIELGYKWAKKQGWDHIARAYEKEYTDLI